MNIIIFVSLLQFISALRINQNQPPPIQLGRTLEHRLRDQYLRTVRMGLMGGLDHGGSTDIQRQATLNDDKRNSCLSRDWQTGEYLDNCISKWDANERLSRVQDLYDRVKEQGISGDLMECGVWRGGMTVYMKALLRSNDDEGRNVWVADSFNGMPSAERLATNPTVKGSMKEMTEEEKKQNRMLQDDLDWSGAVDEPGLDGKIKAKNILTVELQLVRDNFVRFDLLDNGVKFIPGYFNESLPHVAEHGLKQLALLRVDGDMYSSTMEVLDNLYHLVTPGGYVLFDDWVFEPSQRAVLDFFKKHNLDKNIIQVGRVTPQDNDVLPNAKFFSEETPMLNMNTYAHFQKPM